MFNQPNSQQPFGQPAELDTNAFTNAAAQAVQQSQPAQQFAQPGVGPSPTQSPGAAAGFNSPQQQSPQDFGGQYSQQQSPPYGTPTAPTPQPQGFQGYQQAGNPWGQGTGDQMPPFQQNQQPQSAPQWQPPAPDPFPQQQQYQPPSQYSQQQTPAQQQYPMWDAQTAEKLQQFGVDPQLSPSEQVNRLTQRISELTPYAQFGQQMASHREPVQQSEQQQPAEDEFNVDEYFNKAWGAPQWNQQYDVAIQNGMVERDSATGMFRPAQGFEMMVSPQLLHGLNEAMQFQTQNVQKIFRENPYRQFYQVLREPIKREIEREARSLVQQELQQVKSQDYLSKFQEKNSDWLFTTDHAGRRVYSQAGDQFIREAEALVDAGVDVIKAVEYAERITQSARPQRNQPSAQQQPQQPQQQPTQQFGQQFPQQQVLPFMQPQQQAPQQPMQPQASYQMMPQAGFQNPPMMQRPMSPEMASAAQQQSFLQSALQRSSYTPSAVGAPGAAQPPATQFMSQDGLESMFTSAANQLGAA